MLQNPYNIALIVTPDAGTILLTLAKTHTLWIRKSHQHMSLIAQLEQKTTYTAPEGISPEELVLEYLDTIDLHHPEWQQIHVLGAPLTEELEEAVRSYGNIHVRNIAQGFTIDR
jgi:hypothetical protein